MKKLTLALMAVLAMALVIGFAGCANGNSKKDSDTTSGDNPFIGTWVSSERWESAGNAFVKLTFGDSNVSAYASADGSTWTYITVTPYTHNGNSMQMQPTDVTEGWSGTVSNGVLLIENDIQLFKQ